MGRTQEWNISRKELKILAELGILTEEQLNEVIVTEYNPQVRLLEYHISRLCQYD